MIYNFVDPQKLLNVLEQYKLLQYFESLSGNTISYLARLYIHDFVHLLDTKGQPEEEDYHDVCTMSSYFYSLLFLL